MGVSGKNWTECECVSMHDDSTTPRNNVTRFGPHNGLDQVQLVVGRDQMNKQRDENGNGIEKTINDIAKIQMKKQSTISHKYK